MSVDRHLSDEEVERRLKLITELPNDIAERTASELYQFGERSLSHHIDITHRLDTKAAVITGYSSGVLWTLYSTYATWSAAVNALGFVVVVVAALTATIAALLAAHTLNLRDFLWFSQEDLLNEDCLKDPTKTKRFRVLALMKVLTSYEAGCALKARRLRKAQRLLTGALVFLLSALFYVAAARAMRDYRWMQSR